MRLFKKVVIVGTGLIGGSMGLAIKKNRLADTVIGISRRKSTLSLARKIGAIDIGTRDFNAAAGADLLILAVPVNTLIELSKKLAKIVGLDCIVTDVGSTKEKIVEKLNKLFPMFVGAHPLAGLEKPGIANACPHIFKNTICIITPVKFSNKKSLCKITALWKALGSKVIFMTAAEHDRIAAAVSHLPHAAAFALIGSVPAKYLKFAASGLKDTTRVAASDPELWSQVFLSNKKNVLRSLGTFEKNIAKIKSAVRREDCAALISILNRSQQIREKIA
ncbi:MAG: prephenate dehydrogenase [Candidatus Omnitrophota bacterium]